MANKKTVAVSPSEGLSVVLETTKTKKGNHPGSLVHRSHLKKDFRKMAKTVVNQVGSRNSFNSAWFNFSAKYTLLRNESKWFARLFI